MLVAQKRPAQNAVEWPHLSSPDGLRARSYVYAEGGLHKVIDEITFREAGFPNIPPKAHIKDGERDSRSSPELEYMPKITADIPSSLNSALNDEIARTTTDASSIVTAALAQYLKTPVHTLFQVSTSGAQALADPAPGA
jgi:hypothetical protein